MKFSFLNQEANRLTPAANRVAICSSNLKFISRLNKTFLARLKCVSRKMRKKDFAR